MDFRTAGPTSDQGALARTGSCCGSKPRRDCRVGRRSNPPSRSGGSILVAQTGLIRGRDRRHGPRSLLPPGRPTKRRAHRQWPSLLLPDGAKHPDRENPPGARCQHGPDNGNRFGRRRRHGPLAGAHRGRAPRTPDGPKRDRGLAGPMQTDLQAPTHSRRAPARGGPNARRQRERRGAAGHARLAFGSARFNRRRRASSAFQRRPNQ